MRQQRLYVEGPPNRFGWSLPEKRAHYLKRVLRLKAGYTLTVFNGSGNEWEVQLADASASRLEIIQPLDPKPVSGLNTLLIQCLGRGERMDYALQKATELGVTRIMPITSERTEVRLSGDRAEKRLAHWRGVIVQACEQSGRSRLPDLFKLRHIDAALSEIDETYTRRLALSPEGSPLSRDGTVPEGLAVLIGPEGGLTDAELKLAQNFDFEATAFGPRILRTETAGPALLAAAQALWGDLAC